MRPTRPRRRLAAAVALVTMAALPALVGAATADGPGPGAATFTETKLAGSSGGSEPRVAVAPDGSFAVTTTAAGKQVVHRSVDDGVTWPRTAGLPTQGSATIDVEVVATRTGRLVTSELEGAGSALAIRTSYSDDGGATWTAGSSIGSPADTDRPWLAVGPDDPSTHLPRVYLTWHNLSSGLAVHEILVATSTDGGATFGLPVPVTLPGDQSFLDLQCGDGYPSSLSVDPLTGRVYVAFGTRTSVAGGCGAEPVQFNIVTPTRLWVATSADGSAGSWRPVLAYDRSATPGATLPGIFSPLTLDDAGNAYLVFTESSGPDLVGTVRYVWSPPGGLAWSPARTVSAPVGGAVLPHVAAGAAGRVAVSWMGSDRVAADAPWTLRVAVTPDARVAEPEFSEAPVSATTLLKGTAAGLVGQCTSGNPASGIRNGLLCGRAPDNFGTAVTADGRVLLTYPMQSGLPGTGTYVAVQDGGPRLR